MSQMNVQIVTPDGLVYDHHAAFVSVKTIVQGRIKYNLSLKSSGPQGLRIFLMARLSLFNMKKDSKIRT
jgi:hypothetical protein